MKYRQLGRTGLQVSEIGYGAWGIGKSEWMGAEDEVSIKSLKAARDAGVNFFDTALAYGMGHSEQLLGRAFGKSKDVVIASKVPPKNFVWPAKRGTPLDEVFPKEYVLSCLDKTLKNLGREHVDVYQFHVWTDEWAKEERGGSPFPRIDVQDPVGASDHRAYIRNEIDPIVPGHRGKRKILVADAVI